MNGVMTGMGAGGRHAAGRGVMACRAAGFALALLMSPLNSAQEAGPMPPESEQVNINRADAMTIAEVLDGVGMVKAEAIVSYRELHGDFASLEELTQVSGIGDVTVQRNEERIRFE